MNIKILTCLFMAGLSLATAQKDCSSGFKDGAQDFVKVNYVTEIRRGKEKIDYTKAEISWLPQDMLSDQSCFNMKDTALLFKTEANSEYQTANVPQQVSGQASKWILNIKPCLTYHFAIKVTGESESIFELTNNLLGPATDEEISKTNFVPEAPTDFTYDVGAEIATLNWRPSDCARSYEIVITKDGDDSTNAITKYADDSSNSIQVEGLEPCSKYETFIRAYLNEDAYESGDLQVEFATKPRLDAAKNMDVIIEPTIDSAKLNLRTWTASCIDQYQITICNVNGDCEPTAVVTKSTSPIITYEFQNLSPCTDFTVEIQPFYPDTEVEKKIVTFRTLSPDAKTQSVGQLTTQQIGSGSMMLQWPDLKCAKAYKVYQKEGDSGEWINVAETSDREVTMDNLTPCTQFEFAVSALLDEQETEKSFSEPITFELNEQDPFNAPNLSIDNADTSAEITWDHATCIQSYMIKVCQEAYVDCKEVTVEPTGTKSITHKMESLDPCTQYSLEIIPIIAGKTFVAKVHDFTTTNGTPQAPQGFAVKQMDDKIMASWERVQCATGYKIYYSDDQDSEEKTKVVGPSEASFEDLIPCTTYYYSVATLVDEQESEKTQVQSISIQPQLGNPPVLKILSNENDIITFTIDMDEMNKRCSAVQYEVSYSETGAQPYGVRSFDPETNKELKLSFSGASNPNSILQAKIRYNGGDELWSDVASSREPGDRSPRSQLATNSTTLVPIVVGVILVLIVIVLIIIFVVRRKHARNNYDAEKADNGRKGSNHGPEETQKLNEDA